MDVEWIKNSLLYKSFDTEDEEDDVNLENYQYVCNNTINNRNDMVSMLQTIQYWGVYELPPSIIQYFMIHDIRREEEQFDVVIEDCIINPFVWLYRVYNMDMVIQPEIIRHLNFVDSDVELDLFPYEHFVRLDFYKELSKKRCIHKILAKIACKCNNVECLEFIHNLGHLKLVEEYTNIAARYGSISCLIFLHENKYPWIYKIWEYAVVSGNINCLQYLHDNCYFKLLILGHYRFIFYRNIHIEGPLPYLFCLAIYHGHVNCLKYLHTIEQIPIPDRLITLASKLGCLDSLKYLVEICSNNICNDATFTPYVDCLQYLHKSRVNLPNGGYLWNVSTCNFAAQHGYLNCLIYLHENGCPWNEQTCNEATRQGHLDCLIYLHENGCPWNEQICNVATRFGHLDCLIYLHENGCPWDEQTCKIACKIASLDCLIYLHENGCPWNNESYVWAAVNGKLSCIKYLHENGCPWDEYTCYYAAAYGYLDILKYAHENGCSMRRVFACGTCFDDGCNLYILRHKPFYWYIYNLLSLQ